MDAQMDLDWCLCGKRTLPGRNHCSKRCRDRDELQELDFHDSESSSDEGTPPRPLASSSVRIPIAIPPPPSSSRRKHSPSSKHSHSHSHRSNVLVVPAAAGAAGPPLDASDPKCWKGYGNRERIQAWASAIPADCGSFKHEALSFYPDTPRSRPEFPLSRQRAAPPTLNVSPSQPAQTSNPSSPINCTLSALADRSRLRGVSHGSGGGGGSYSVSTVSLGTETPDVFAPTTTTTSRRRPTAYVHASPVRDTTTLTTTITATTTSSYATVSAAASAAAVVAKGPKGVIDHIARRFRAWGVGSGTSSSSTTCRDPVQICVRKQTTTVPVEMSPTFKNSPSSPHSHSHPHLSSPRPPLATHTRSAAAATTRARRGPMFRQVFGVEEEEEDEDDYDQEEEEEDEEEESSASPTKPAAVYSLNLPLGRPNFLDSEIQASLSLSMEEEKKRGVWISGRRGGGGGVRGRGEEKKGKKGDGEDSVYGHMQYGPAFYEKPVESKRAHLSLSLESEEDEEEEEDEIMNEKERSVAHRVVVVQQQQQRRPQQPRPQQPQQQQSVQRSQQRSSPFLEPAHHLEAFRARGRKPRKICEL